MFSYTSSEWLIVISFLILFIIVVYHLVLIMQLYEKRFIPELDHVYPYLSKEYKEFQIREVNDAEKKGYIVSRFQYKLSHRNILYKRGNWISRYESEIYKILFLKYNW